MSLPGNDLRTQERISELEQEATQRDEPSGSRGENESRPPIGGAAESQTSSPQEEWPEAFPKSRRRARPPQHALAEPFLDQREDLDHQPAEEYLTDPDSFAFRLEHDPPASWPEERQSLLDRISELEGQVGTLETTVDKLRTQLHAMGEDDGSARKSEASRTKIVACSVEELFEDRDLPPLFTGGRGNDPWKHLEGHYGHLLTHFGAQEDLLYLDRLRQYDERLVKTLARLVSRRRKREEDEQGRVVTPTLGQMIPSERVRGDRNLLEREVGEVLRDRDLARLLRARLNNLLREELQ